MVATPLLAGSGPSTRLYGRSARFGANDGSGLNAHIVTVFQNLESGKTVADVDQDVVPL